MIKKLLATMRFAIVFAPMLVLGASAADPSLALTHVSVIDATGSALKTDMTVVIKGQRIAEMGKTQGVKIPKGATVIDGRGKFLIPGLWDMHVHTIFGDWIPKEENLILPMFVANGVTGVRDMGGDLDALKDWRARIAAGNLFGPRMVISGPMLDGPTPRFPSSAPVSTAEDGRDTVDRLKNAGVDFIKIQSLIPRDGYFAAAAEARRIGIPFVGHVPDAVRASEASNAGQKSMEHLIGIFEASTPIEDELLKGPKGPGRFLSNYDDSHFNAIVALLAKNQTWQVPTLYWERGQWLIDKSDFAHDPLNKYAPAGWRDRTWPMFTKDILKDMDIDPLPVRERFVQLELEMVNKLHRAGVPFMAGTDTAAGVHVFPGFSLHDELALFVKAGFTPMEALQTATLNPAKFLGLTADQGTVEKGKIADLVLLDANPLEDISNTRKIHSVVLAGRFLSRQQLDDLLHGVEVAAAGSK